MLKVFGCALALVLVLLGLLTSSADAQVATETDTFNPACPGIYDTARFLQLFGLSAVPAGITARVVLTHRP